MSRFRMILCGMPILLTLGAAAAPPHSAPVGPPGSYSATITGAVSKKLKGVAFFDPRQVTPEGADLKIDLGEEDREGISFTRPVKGLPAVGTHRIRSWEIEDVSDFSVEYYKYDGDNVTAYSSQSGALRITSSSAKEVRGTFTFRAVNSDDARVVNVQGEFVASLKSR